MIFWLPLYYDIVYYTIICEPDLWQSQEKVFCRRLLVNDLVPPEQNLHRLRKNGLEHLALLQERGCSKTRLLSLDTCAPTLFLRVLGFVP